MEAKIRLNAYAGGHKMRLGTEESAGSDLACTKDITLKPGEVTNIECKVAVALPKGTFGMVVPRSSTGKKIEILNTAGIIDADYRGELIVRIRNHTDEVVEYKDGDYIAQLIIVPFLKPMWDYVDNIEDLGETERGTGAEGSTDRKES